MAPQDIVRILMTELKRLYKMEEHPYYDRESTKSSYTIAAWSGVGIVVLLIILLFTSCTKEVYVWDQRYPLDGYVYEEPLRGTGQAFVTIDGTQNYQQTIYLDTLENYTYTKVFAESTDMAENQKYNGESNIRAVFSTDKYWSYSNGVFSNYPVYYVYPFSVRFVPPAARYGYYPTKLALFTQQMVGPIPKSAVINNETLKIYMDVSYDGLYRVKDSILIELRPK